VEKVFHISFPWKFGIAITRSGTKLSGCLKVIKLFQISCCSDEESLTLLPHDKQVITTIPSSNLGVDKSDFLHSLFSHFINSFLPLWFAAAVAFRVTSTYFSPSQITSGSDSRRSTMNFPISILLFIQE
jgi:hypothetical protein